MFLGDLNLLFLLFFFLFSTLITNSNTSLHLLLTAELLWITLYSITLVVGLTYDNLNLLSLTFFFLIFSAVEFGVGLVLLLLQHLLSRTLYLDSSGNTPHKYTINSNQTPLINRLNWKA